MNGLTRAWSEAIADLADRVQGGVTALVLISFAAALLFGLCWYAWPFWHPTGWRLRFRPRSAPKPRRRLRLTGWRWNWRWRWRRRRRRTAEILDDLPPDALPDLPAAVLTMTADELAAAGRFAEAVRERLRAVIRELIERGVLPNSPGWTVTELAVAAGRARPELAEPLDAAVRVFSDIWYGLAPAGANDDAAMRAHAATIRQRLAAAPAGNAIVATAGGGAGGGTGSGAGGGTGGGAVGAHGRGRS